jgi:hypothetical protein
MKTRTTLATATVAVQLLATLGLCLTPASSAHGLATEDQARAVVSEFFRTINAREFGRTCNMMSPRFYVRNQISGRKQCVLGLTVGFANSPTVFFRILGVGSAGERTLVSVLANGAPGQIVLVEESGLLRVLALHGS